jgi:Tfp pilus assembly protein PilX
MQEQQRGAMLLLVLLLLASAATLPLLHSLSSNTARQERAQRTAEALARAKDALLSYAVSYPDQESHEDAEAGPGYLPCPDLDNDGTAKTAGVDLVCGPNTLGRLPWALLGLEDLRDGSGERLWYAVAADFRAIGQKHVPLNSESRGQFSVDGRDDIVAVILAPGAPLFGQTRAAAGVNLTTNYLEGGNAEQPSDTRFASRGTGAGPFNDRLLSITQQEIAQAMEKRALSEVRARLLRFKEVFGVHTGTAKKAFPLLSRLRKPRAASLLIAGKADSGSTANRLRDAGEDFQRGGVMRGSVVFNTTDGSYGTVVAVGPHSVDVNGWLGGSINRLSVDNQYQIAAIPLLEGSVGAAAFNGAGDTGLSDRATDFPALGVKQGDAIEKLGAGTTGVVTRVRPNGLSARILKPGIQRFAPGDRYRVVTNGGLANGGASGRLRDTRPGRLFTPGDVLLVQNLAAGTFAYGASVLNPSTVQLASPPNLDLFDANDPYLLSAFVDPPERPASEAWLPVHRLGEPFPTGFEVNWRNQDLSVPASLPPDAGARIWEAFAVGSVRKFQYDGAAQRSACTWYAADIAHCAFWLEKYLTGVATGGSATQLTDTASEFDYSGAEAGDRLILPNRTDRPQGVISAIAGHVITVDSLQGTAGPTAINAGDAYRVQIATRSVSGVAEPGTKALTLSYTSPAFDAVRPRDAYVVVHDASGAFVGSGSVQSRAPGGHVLVLAGLTGGSRTILKAGDRYSIRWGVIEHRFVALSVQGEVSPALRNERRVRDVSAHGLLRQTAPVMTLRDYDGFGKPLGVGVVNGTPGVANLQIDVRGIQMHLAAVSGIAENRGVGSLRDNERDFRAWGVQAGDWVEDLHTRHFGRVKEVAADPHVLDIDGIKIDIGSAYRVYVDLPPWFTANGWERLIYVAEADSARPVGAGTSIPCLRVTTLRTGGCTKVLAVASGDILPQASGVDQNRAAPDLNNFLEGENGTVNDGRFVGTHFDPTNNDQVRIVE